LPSSFSVSTCVFFSFAAFLSFFFFFFTDPAPTDIYSLSLHDALPILPFIEVSLLGFTEGSNTSLLVFIEDSLLVFRVETCSPSRSEEHTSELQSRFDLVCRLLLEKKKST